MRSVRRIMEWVEAVGRGALGGPEKETTAPGRVSRVIIVWVFGPFSTCVLILMAWLCPSWVTEMPNLLLVMVWLTAHVICLFLTVLLLMTRRSLCIEALSIWVYWSVIVCAGIVGTASGLSALSRHWLVGLITCVALVCPLGVIVRWVGPLARHRAALRRDRAT